jgi:hypothetical protein
MNVLNIHDPSLIELAHEVPRVRAYCFDEQETLWNNTVRECRKYHVCIPSLLWKLTRASFLIQIGEDREFCEEAGLPYAEIDRHWHDIRAAAALWYYSQLTSV